MMARMRCALGLRPQAHRVADDGAVALQLGDAVLHRGARDAQLLAPASTTGMRALSRSRAMQLAVGVVHACPYCRSSTGKMYGFAMKLPSWMLHSGSSRRNNCGMPARRCRSARGDLHDPLRRRPRHVPPGAGRSASPASSANWPTPSATTSCAGPSSTSRPAWPTTRAIGVIELMPVSDAQRYAFKYVNGHPSNTARGLLHRDGLRRAGRGRDRLPGAAVGADRSPPRCAPRDLADGGARAGPARRAPHGADRQRRAERVPGAGLPRHLGIEEIARLRRRPARHRQAGAQPGGLPGAARAARRLGAPRRCAAPTS